MLKFKLILITLLVIQFFTVNIALAQDFVEFCPNPDATIENDEPTFVPCSELEGGGMSSVDTGSDEQPVSGQPAPDAVSLLNDAIDSVRNALTHLNTRNDFFSIQTALTSIDNADARLVDLSNQFNDKPAIQRGIGRASRALQKADRLLRNLSGVSANQLGSSKKKVSKAKRLLKKVLRAGKKLKRQIK